MTSFFSFPLDQVPESTNEVEEGDTGHQRAQRARETGPSTKGGVSGARPLYRGQLGVIL